MSAPANMDLIIACQTNDLETVKRLITHENADYNYSDEGKSCLFIACERGFSEIALYLLGLPAIDCNTYYKPEPDTPYTYIATAFGFAYIQCSPVVVRRFLEFPTFNPDIITKYRYDNMLVFLVMIKELQAKVAKYEQDMRELKMNP
jgi:hypothetical protein